MPALRPLLPILAAILLLAACGSDDEEPTSTATETVSTETSTTDTTTTAVEELRPSETVLGDAEVTFTTPSKNINCMIIASAVRCDILEADFEPPAADDSCEFDYGNSIGIDAGGEAQFLCVSDAVPRGPILEYGTYVETLGFTCSSTDAGVDCSEEATGNGFFLSRQSYGLR